MSLNIKNAETYRLVKELADETGESMTTAVTEAVRERLDRVRAERGGDREARFQRALELLAVMRERAPAGYFDQDFDELIYDEKGLPQVIVDTSAIVAMLRNESDAAALSEALKSAAMVRLSAASYVELSVVVDGLGDPVLSGALDAVLAAYEIVIEPLTEEQARIARAAYQRFGKGSGHPARLNMGDCFSYALARELGEPLLFKGEDFKRTDIEIVIEPARHKRLSEIVAAYGVTT